MKGITLCFVIFFHSHLWANDQELWKKVYTIKFSHELWDGILPKAFVKVEQKVFSGKKLIRFHICTNSINKSSYFCNPLGKKEGYISSLIIPDILPTHNELLKSSDLYSYYYQQIEFYHYFTSYFMLLGLGTVGGVTGYFINTFFGKDFNTLAKKYPGEEILFQEWLFQYKVLYSISGFSLGVVIDYILDYHARNVIYQATTSAKDLPFIYNPEEQILWVYSLTLENFEKQILSL